MKAGRMRDFLSQIGRPFARLAQLSSISLGPSFAAQKTLARDDN
jgi:hypothetical protein